MKSVFPGPFLVPRLLMKTPLTEVWEYSAYCCVYLQGVGRRRRLSIYKCVCVCVHSTHVGAGWSLWESVWGLGSWEGKGKMFYFLLESDLCGIVWKGNKGNIHLCTDGWRSKPKHQLSLSASLRCAGAAGPSCSQIYLNDTSFLNKTGNVHVT